MSKKRRTLRGGSFYSVTGDLRTIVPYRREPANRFWGGGFRIVVVRGKP